jgi:hypothetical protein
MILIVLDFRKFKRKIFVLQDFKGDMSQRKNTEKRIGIKHS